MIFTFSIFVLCFALDPTISNVTVTNLVNTGTKWTASVSYNLVCDVKDSASLFVWADYSPLGDEMKWCTYLAQSGATGWKTKPNKPGLKNLMNIQIPYYAGSANIGDAVIFRVYAENKIVPDTMVGIPAGTFTMGGTEADAPPHPVTISKLFLMDPTEVTQAMYKRLMGYTPANISWGDYNRPITRVSWCDAVLYCNARSKAHVPPLDTCYMYTMAIKAPVNIYGDSLCSELVNVDCDYTKSGFRLPTEAEWEYACRAGTTTTYWWGDVLNNDTDTAFAWYYMNTIPDTFSNGNSHVVGQKKPNDFGLYDMLGNVWEFVNDYYDVYDVAANIDPIGPIIPPAVESHAARGGSYNVSNGADRLSCSFRKVSSPSYQTHDMGFRCVRKTP